jgi:lysophospholipase L1-like esterase
VSEKNNLGIKKHFQFLSTTKKIVLSLLAFVFSLLLLEITATVYNSNPDWFIKVQENNTAHMVFNKAALSSRFYSLQTEPYFITRNFNIAKNDDVKRIFVIGDAFVSGWPYSENQSLTTKVESVLTNFVLHGQVELIPVSFAGLNSSHAVELVQEIKEYEPDLVVLFLGHNEFYTHEDLTLRVGSFNSSLLDVFNQFFIYTGLKKKIIYNRNIDDLERLLPTLLSKQIVTHNDLDYNIVIENFRNNITQIIKTCEKENINLLFPVLTDNLLLPPLGIVQDKSEFQADIIFSNARMAIYRDGDIEKAKELFTKTKELDVVKLRIPDDIKSVYDIIKKSALVRIDSLFEMNCENNIPSSKLFLDYIHPNNTGLNIIATAITKRIIENLNKDVEAARVDSIGSFVRRRLTVSFKDSVMAEFRLHNAKEKMSDKNL